MTVAKQWLGTGVMVAGLGAALMTSQAVAGADTGTSTSGDASSSSTGAADPGPARDSKTDDPKPDAKANGQANDKAGTTAGDTADDTADAKADDKAEEAALAEAAGDADDTSDAAAADDTTTDDETVAGDTGDEDDAVADDSDADDAGDDTADDATGNGHVEVPQTAGGTAVTPATHDPARDDAPTPAAHTPLPAVRSVDESVSATGESAAAEEETAPVAQPAPALEVVPAASTATAHARTLAASATTASATATTTAAKPRVTLGSMFSGVLKWFGFGSSQGGTNIFQSLWFALTGHKPSRTTTPPVSVPGPVITPAPTPTPPQIPAAPQLIWATNFTDLAEALKYWGLQTGRWGQSAGENQYYTDGSNVSIDAQGNLVIDIRKELAPDGLGGADGYTSARVTTYGKQSVEPPVRITARMQLPYTTGTLPAFWTVGLEPGHEFDWPRQGEIDIAEFPGFTNGAGRDTYTGNIRGPAVGDNTVDVKLDNIGANVGTDLSAGFHEFGIDWYPDRITWHVDGVAVATVTEAQYEAQGGDWTPFSGAWPHYLILNTAVGNPWTGDPDASSTFPAQMKVDWVKVWKL